MNAYPPKIILFHCANRESIPAMSPSSPAQVLQHPHSAQPESPDPHPHSIPGLRSGRPNDTQCDPYPVHSPQMAQTMHWSCFHLCLPLGHMTSESELSCSVSMSWSLLTSSVASMALVAIMLLEMRPWKVADGPKPAPAAADVDAEEPSRGAAAKNSS